jgi:hypothetical protein
MFLDIFLCLMLAVNPPAGFDARPILDAIRKVETGAEQDPTNAVGDSGASLGPYQIQYNYWKDALLADSSLTANGETYDNVRDSAYAERVILAYWKRYAPKWDYQTLAKIHNGGPAGHKKASTKGYWTKVQKALAK